MGRVGTRSLGLQIWRGTSLVLGLASAIGLAMIVACSEPDHGVPSSLGSPVTEPPTLVLITLDTTRADLVAPEGDAAVTPNLALLAARGLVFRQAYSTAPTTLPAHASMMTGLYPAGHGIHENGRRVAAEHDRLASRLARSGYRTAAFLSGFPLERQFGLAAGFEVYDDDFGAEGGSEVERSAEKTTDRAVAYLASAPSGPLFLWIHYYDPHEPYAPIEPFASRFPEDPYRGEIAAMDEQVGRLVAALEDRSRQTGEIAPIFLVSGDHGEGRGDHGEMLHGNLLYQGVIRVPMILAGSSIEAGERHDAVSIRQIFSTLLGLAGQEGAVDLGGGSLLAVHDEPVLGEAMQPFLAYRWQPQVMAVQGASKVIRSGRLEAYDIVADPREEVDRSADMETGSFKPPRNLLKALSEYPLPSSSSSPLPINAAASESLDEEAARRLASLGYIASTEVPDFDPKAPRPVDMTHLFAKLDRGSRDFVAGRWHGVIESFEEILEADPANLMAAVRLAAAHSFLGDDDRALQFFSRARRIDPKSMDVRHYLALHQLGQGRSSEAAALFEEVLQSQPDRLSAVESLASIRTREGRFEDAVTLHRRAVRLARDPSSSWLALGDLHMEMGQTEAAIEAFEQAQIGASPIHRDLELGVLYLEAGRFADARDSLDTVPRDHPAYAMALFKRAQVSVLLREPDRATRVRAAIEGADRMTGPLIERERLFEGLR